MRLEPGDHVHYVSFNKIENGIVKRVTEHGAFVVYNCGGEWDRYMDYTAALTGFDDLRLGWHHGQGDSECDSHSDS